MRNLLRCLTLFCAALTLNTTAMAQIKYLALGDSYTIGEGVEYGGNFPNQLVAMLRVEGIPTDEVEIIARTGWTTFELQAYLEQYPPSLPVYDIVTLLIGVNNQYRGLSVEQYAADFESLLQYAIGKAGDQKERVVVLSIPDWGVTPFAKNRDRDGIAKKIDLFNSVKKEICDAYQITFIEITEDSRKAAEDEDLLAPDGLHPSGYMYASWSWKIRGYLLGILK